MHAVKNPSMRMVGAGGVSDSHSNYLPSQQYELANMESQPSTAHYDPSVAGGAGARSSHGLRSSEVPG